MVTVESADGGTVRIWRKFKRVTGTHQLESADGGTHQGIERILASEGHSRSGECKGRGESGQGNNLSKQAGLTCWREQRERQVGTWKESKQARGAHLLEGAER
jgi:hypothetical protein